MTTDEGEELLRLSAADNFRDVAGPERPYRTDDGRTLRRGVLYRSNEFQLTDAEVPQVDALGITHIYDLRTQGEVDEHPDTELDGATWRHLEVAGIPMDAVRNLTTAAEGEQVMHEVYRAFVEHPGARAAYRELLTRIAHDTSGAGLFHCTAGKDRTGWASALLLYVAGVPDQTILEDYLLTNDHSMATRGKYLGLIAEHLGEDHVAAYEAVMVAEEAYLRTAYAAVEREYGDRDAYLRDGLGLVEEVLSGIRRRLVAD